MINHDLFNTYDKWFEQPLEVVFVQSLRLMRGRYRTCGVQARTSQTDVIKLFQFELPKRKMTHLAYDVEPGCIITDNTGSYECLAVTYGKMPKVPIAITRPIYKFDESALGVRTIIPTFIDEDQHMRDRFILYKEWFKLPLNPVNIESVVFKKGEHDFRWSKARSSGNDMFKLYQIQNTKADFNKISFPPEPGCIIRDESGTYRCLSVCFPVKPKYPLFITQRIS